MAKELLFPSIADIVVLSADVNVAIVRVDAQCTVTGAVCPDCGTRSSRVHVETETFSEGPQLAPPTSRPESQPVPGSKDKVPMDWRQRLP